MPLNKQRTFNRVARHILKQAQPAVSKHGGNCAYRTGDGLMCAVGCLIPKAKYDENMEGTSIRNATDVQDVLGIVGNPDAVGFLVELQRAHDNGAMAAGRGDITNEDWLSRWKDQMSYTAKMHNLNADALQ